MIFKFKKKKHIDSFLPPGSCPMLTLPPGEEPYKVRYRTEFVNGNGYIVATVYMEKSFVKRTYVWTEVAKSSYWKFTGQTSFTKQD